MHSSYVRRAAYEGGTLLVQFRDGQTCQYEDIAFDLWMEFMAAPSKGKWVHANLFSRPYALVG